MPVRQEASLALFDGNMGYGQHVGRSAMNWAIGAARQHGHAVMGLRNVHHIGRVGTNGDQAAAAAGMISVHFVNGVSGPPAVAPFGGSDARLSTTPVCIAVPGDPPHVLDFATFAIALGLCRVVFKAGRAVPEGALVDAEGRPRAAPEKEWPARRGAQRAKSTGRLHVWETRDPRTPSDQIVG